MLKCLKICTDFGVGSLILHKKNVEMLKLLAHSNWTHNLNEFRYSAGFFCLVHLLCLQNTFIDTDFDVIKNNFNIVTSMYLMLSKEHYQKNPTENLDSI